MDTPTGRIGIIDIGSNSIRLVVYDQQKRAPVAIYNEKVMCALGKGLASSGLLNPAGVKMAMHAVRRYLALARGMEVTSLHIIATSAVRDAKDGKGFVAYLEDMHGIVIDIISGETEARLGAHGVAASMHKPRGLAGDLGGGSFELVRLEGGRIAEQTTLPIGVLRLADEGKGDRDKMRKLAMKAFQDMAWLEKEPIPAFYAIGGSFRALARMYMEREAYPLQVLHEYRIGREGFLAFLGELLSTPDDKLEKWPGASAKRISALPPAALVLEQVLNLAKPECIIFSASGIREGYLYEKLSPYLREQDGLLASCRELAGRVGRFPAYAGELLYWMKPLFAEESPEAHRLRLAYCLLSDVSLHIHPDYRAEYAWYRVIQSALTCLSHQERVTLALAVYHRYQFKRKLAHPALRLIGEREMRWARLVGAAANLAYHLCGSIPGSLPDAPLALENGKISLHFNARLDDLNGDAVAKRLEQLQESYAEWHQD